MVEKKNPEDTRFEVRALVNGEGYVIVDTHWKEKMIGPWPKNKKGKQEAIARALELEAEAIRRSPWIK